MKLLNTIAACILFSLVIISCGEDDPVDDMEMEDPVVLGLDGEWTATSLDLDITQVSEFFGEQITSTVVGTAKNMDYDLKMDNGNFTAEGGYDLDLTIMAGGQTTMTSQSYTDGSGEGTYVTEDDKITITGQLMEFNLDGIFMSDQTTEPGEATYVIEDGVLTINQEQAQSFTDEVFGSTSTATIISVSTWTRK